MAESHSSLPVKRYAPREPVAIESAAFGLEFALVAQPAAPFTTAHDGRTAIVDICGPLTLSDPFFDRYSAISARVDAALASPAERVVLRVNSPGGDVFGVFDCARHMKAGALAAKKPLLAFTEASMCSSAYALSCAAQCITISDTAQIGSIGVISTALDQSKADAAQGISFALITSGARKADGNPHTPFTDDARAAMQMSVDTMAGVFFEHVRQARPQLGDPSALQAGVAVGRAALALGLCDSVAGWDSFLASLESSQSESGESAILPSAASAGAQSAASTKKSPMADKEDDKPKEDAVRASLVTASESDDPKKAARAKAALAAYDSDEDDKSKGAKGASAEFPPKKDDEKDDEKDAKGEKDSDESKALKAAMATMGSELAALREREAKREQAQAAAERSSFLASRPDLSPEFLKTLEALPFAQLKSIVEAIPAPQGFVNPFAASVSPSVVPSHAYGAPASLQSEIDARMGLTPKGARGVSEEGAIQRFGVAVAAPAAPAAPSAK